VVFQDQCFLEAIVEHLAVNLQVAQRATSRSWAECACANNRRVEEPGVREVQVSAIDGIYDLVMDPSLAKLRHDMCPSVGRSGQVDNISLHQLIFHLICVVRQTNSTS